MTYGLNLYSDAGLLAFSSAYKSYRLLQKLSLTVQTNSGPSGYSWRFTVTSTTGNPICFVKPTGTVSGHAGAINILQLGISGNDYSFSVITQDTAKVAGSGPVYVYVFVPGSTNGTSYGINVFDGSGVNTFSTNDRLLKIAAYYITIGVNSGTSTIPSSLSYGSIPSQYAINSPSIGIKFVNTGGGTTVILGLGTYVDSSQVLQYDAALQIGATGGGPSNPLFIDGSIYIPVIDSSLYD